ncbi:MAG: hypothetical protein NZ959_10885 [Armatimonadetes bacterium]|nr:hypothetical protein [Armatimonadota bacterium]MDW8122842.1 hypothetical protein [Armatimonadota bacterium]
MASPVPHRHSPLRQRSSPKPFVTPAKKTLPFVWFLPFLPLIVLGTTCFGCRWFAVKESRQIIRARQALRQIQKEVATLRLLLEGKVATSLVGNQRATTPVASVSREATAFFAEVP